MPYLTGNEPESAAQIYCRLNNVNVPKVRNWEDASREAHNGKYRIEAWFDDCSPIYKKLIIEFASDEKFMGDDYLSTADKISPHLSGYKLSHYTHKGISILSSAFELLSRMRQNGAPPCVTKREFFSINRSKEA